jgi:hypothetical protein
MKINPILKKAEWFTKHVAEGDIKPYVFVRSDNKIQAPGSRHKLDWFSKDVLYLDPLDLVNINFAELIYHIEGKAFGPSDMAMPRWVFYDCGIIPGFVAGFAMREEKLPESLRKILPKEFPSPWVPLSLFIIIPTMAKGQWCAHNLCAVNSLLPLEDRFYGLGFLSKAFGLWYANVEQCLGFTQWGGPALKLHTHYGHMEIVTAYTPVHSHARTLTYRVNVDAQCWERFFTREPDYVFLEKYQRTNLVIDPNDENTMLLIHNRLMNKEGPYFLSAADIQSKKINDTLEIYTTKNQGSFK